MTIRKDKRWMQKIVSIVLCAGMVFANPVPSVEVRAETVQEKIDKATKEKKEALDKINKSKESKQEALGQKEVIDKEIDVINTELSQIDAIITEADNKIAQKEAEIADYEIQIEENDEQFKSRIRAMDEMDNASYIDMLLNSESLSDFLAKLETIREISQHDQDIINNMIDLKTGVENSKAEIEAARAEQQEARNLTAGKKDQLQQKLDEQSALIAKLDSDIGAYEKAYNDAVAQENSLKASLQSQLSKSSTATTSSTPQSTSSSTSVINPGGKFVWPAPSYTYISSEFGYRIHPVLKTKKYHSGMDMAAPGGSNILAAESGTVRSAGWNGGYGYCVVIDHGGGLATLYGHASKLLVSAGQKVSKGQVIALVGTTGMSTGNHLHFEALVNGKVTNPRNYL